MKNRKLYLVIALCFIFSSLFLYRSFNYEKIYKQKEIKKEIRKDSLLRAFNQELDSIASINQDSVK